MIITPTITAAQNTTLANNNLTVDGLLETLIEYKLNWMKARPGYAYNNCSLSVAPSGGSVTITLGQENFLKLDFGAESLVEPINDPIENMRVWAQNFIDETVRHLDLGEPKII